VPKRIIIDTDPGIDDAMAILLAFQSPELEVVGLTSIFGNVHTSLGTQNALRLAELAGRPAVPVAAGADLPLVVPLDYVADFVHGQDGLGNVNLPAPQGRPLNQSAAEFIIETVMAQPGQITLVPLGPLTNLALALSLEPRLAQNVAQVVLMGGAATVNGNVTPAAEANIIHDPHAADLVFTAGWPVVMVGLDVTLQTAMSRAYFTELKAADTPFSHFVHDISQFYQAFHRRYLGLDGCHTHDPSAIAYLIDPGLFTTASGPIRVLTEGIATGLTLWDRQRQPWGSENAWVNQPPVKVCLEVDSARLLALFKARITATGI
jgi:uridine nucleosidase